LRGIKDLLHEGMELKKIFNEEEIKSNINFLEELIKRCEEKLNGIMKINDI